MRALKPGWGMRIIGARRAKGLTQAELAHAAGVGAVAVSRWENELSRPQVESWGKLGNALGVPTDWLRSAIDATNAVESTADLRRVESERMIEELAHRGFAVAVARRYRTV